MKIYTKMGDKGTTSLFGGKKVSKSELRIEAYGTVDELNSVLGLCISEIESLPKKDGLTKLRDQLSHLQNELFHVGGRLATETQDLLNKLPRLEESQIQLLEGAMDEMTKTLPPLADFILPGGTKASAALHLARTVCRRAERVVVRLSDQLALDKDAPVESNVLIFLNRLSDFLFVSARFGNHQLGVQDVKWKK